MNSATPLIAIRLPRRHFPADLLGVCDPAIQTFVDASIRVLYQARETIGGQTQFNSSFSLYRGLWAGDAVYITNLASQLGDSHSARQTLDALFSHQLPDGGHGAVVALVSIPDARRATASEYRCPRISVRLSQS